MPRKYLFHFLMKGSMRPSFPLTLFLRKWTEFFRHGRRSLSAETEMFSSRTEYLINTQTWALQVFRLLKKCKDTLFSLLILSIVRHYGINPAPSNDLLGFFAALQNRIFLVNPGHYLIIKLDNGKFPFIVFFSVCCAYTRENSERSG